MSCLSAVWGISPSGMWDGSSNKSRSRAGFLMLPPFMPTRLSCRIKGIKARALIFAGTSRVEEQVSLAEW